MILEIKRWIWDLLIATDQWFNVLLKWPLNRVFGIRGFGYPDETISSVLGKHYGQCRLCRAVCRVLSRVLGDKHCRRAIEDDEGVGKHG